MDYSNQNANDFLELLKTYGVKYYDLREILHSEGMKHHEAFFIADHHWKPETGLWASKKILEFLKNDYNLDVGPEVLNPENFESVIYRDWFLGSQGKKVTLMQARPEDITLLYPKYKTLIQYEIPDAGINITGDFGVTYDMTQIESKDYYKKNSYAAYNHAERPLITIQNRVSNFVSKLLIVHDSFANCVIPFLAMGLREVDALDLRHFTGSLKNYIIRTRPDAVVIMYHSGNPGRSSHENASKEEKRLFDFR